MAETKEIFPKPWRHRARPTVRAAIWLALAFASIVPVSVLWGLSWRGAEDAVTSALAEQLLAEGALIGAHLSDVPVDVLAKIGIGHATDAVGTELQRLATASGLHDLALIGPEEMVLGSEGHWLPATVDRELLRLSASGEAVAGSLYRGADKQLYLTAYTPLVGRPGWVIAVEGSATLGAVDQLARRQFAAGVLLVGAVLALGYFLAVLISRPLQRLEGTLLQVRPGDPPERVDTEGPREVYRVAWAVRALLGAIRDRDREVERSHRRQVEQLVRLAATIAHEVRNPLNAMSLSTERLGRIEDPVQRRAIASRLGAQIGELEAIVTRLLDLTRPVLPHPEPIDPLNLARRIAAESSIAVSVEGPEGESIVTDPTLLGEILRNLLLNAEQAGASQVNVSVSPDNPTHWRWLVSDDGPGISTPDTIFEWFHTSRARGSGLGLPISQRIAEGLGGQLTLVSAKPAVFLIELPARMDLVGDL